MTPSYSDDTYWQNCPGSLEPPRRKSVTAKDKNYERTLQPFVCTSLYQSH
ncbi:hypothetical protein NPIL_83131, partial [Nephila pilipes]